VRVEDLLVGRRDELNRIVAGLNTPGGHAVIFGDRGVGKTSLANVVMEYFVKQFGKDSVSLVRCDPASTFLAMFSSILRARGVDVDTKETTRTKEEGGEAKVSAVFANAGVKSKTSVSATKAGAEDTATPTWMMGHLAGAPGLVVIDEFDVVESTPAVYALATLIKQLSDCGSGFKICVVGVADSVSRLLRGHQSSGRAVVEIKLDRLSNVELRQIILSGEKRTELRFDDSVVDEIVAVSAGYPYFTHLLALKSAEVAVVADRKRITHADLEAAWKDAAVETEASLRSIFDQATQYDDKSLESRILFAASCHSRSEISLKEFSGIFFASFRDAAPSSDVHQCLERLLDGGTILVRIHSTVFRFVDPRMPSFIRLFEKAAHVDRASEERSDG
jgi:hypothetical protein